LGTVQMEEARDGVAIKDAVSVMGLPAKQFSTKSQDFLRSEWGIMMSGISHTDLTNFQVLTIRT
jgi:hypothetical protein